MYNGACVSNGALLTPDEGNPSYRLGKLQPDFPDVALLVASPDSKDLCNIALDKVCILSSFAFDAFLLLGTFCAWGSTCSVQSRGQCMQGCDFTG